MSIKELQEYTRISKYAWYLPEKDRRETWGEQVDRVMGMHEAKFADILPDIQEELGIARSMLMGKNVLGSQRALQFGGTPILKKHARMYNCISTYVDRPRFFQECMWLLLCGCGTGFSAQKHHVAKLPQLRKRDAGPATFVIPDTIEGWADAVGVLVNSYFKTQGGEHLWPEFMGKKVKFDFSKIRPKGSPLSWGGIAPGPEPLQRSLERVEELLDSIVKGGAHRLRPIEAYDIVMHSSDAVLAGGIRRSATICLFSPDDEDMVNAKIGDWNSKNPQRARSNNSALLVRGKTSWEEFRKIIESTQHFGEPGFVWADDTECLYNPCVPADTWAMTAEGPRQACDLISSPFMAMVNGIPYSSSNRGFFRTGIKEVFKITSREGFEVRATANHRFLVVNGNDKEWKTVSEMRPGDKICLHRHDGISWKGPQGFSSGWLVGSFLGDGCKIDKAALLDYWGESRHYMRDQAISMVGSAGLATYQKMTGAEQIAKVGKIRVSSAGLFRLLRDMDLLEKKIGSKVESQGSDFYCGFLGGWFDADGSVQGSPDRGASVRLASSKLDNLKVAQRMLLHLGIYSKIYKDRRPEGYYDLPDGNGGMASFFCNAVHELVIARKSMIVFRDRIGLIDPDKKQALDDLLASYSSGPYDNKFVATVDEIASEGREEVFDCTVPGPDAFDADGFYAHNCVEIGLYGYDEDGNSGWQACNLTEINIRKAKTKEDFLKACEAAAILGTLQAAYTDFAYLGEVSERIIRREALLGCSMTGMMDSPEIAFDPELQKEGAKLILKVNELFAKKIGINPASRATCVKPAGTTSCILGSSSGVHPHHAKRYFRRVQANDLEPSLRHFQKINPLAVEPSVWSANGTDSAITFVCEVPDGSKTKNQIGALELLEYVRLTQQNWVEYGTRKKLLAQPWLRHNVSNTIHVQEGEWDEVAKYIYKHRKYFAGISLLPESGDKDYMQAPFCAVYTPMEIVRKYGDGSLMAGGLIVDGMHAFDGNLWKACDCALGIGESLDARENRRDAKAPPTVFGFKSLIAQKKDWVRRAGQFADRYCDGNLRRLTYLLKDAHNWKHWCDLTREYKDVDWSSMEEDENSKALSVESGSACDGEKCEMNSFNGKAKRAKA